MATKSYLRCTIAGRSDRSVLFGPPWGYASFCSFGAAVDDLFELEAGELLDAADQFVEGKHHNGDAGYGDYGKAPGHHAADFLVEGVRAAGADDDPAREDEVEERAEEK